LLSSPDSITTGIINEADVSVSFAFEVATVVSYWLVFSYCWL
jgi:hypothetical protein